MTSTDLNMFRTHFAGEVILPGDPEYVHASNTFTHKGAPAVIFRPTTSQGVSQTVLFTHQHKLELSVRSGGHSGAGLSTNTGGAVIDLCHLKNIERINKEENLVSVETGATWGEVAKALQPLGLGISSGDTDSVGVGGLTLGGGIGWMVRKYGLALDQLVAAEVVLADGSIVTTDKDTHPDLFWAIRGGGGNFGVVTRFTFQAHPITNVLAGNIQFSRDDIPGLLRGWRDCMRNAPEELTTMLLFMPSFGEAPPMAIVLVCCCEEDEARAQALVAPLLKIGTVLKNDVQRKPYAHVLEAAHPPQDMTIVVKNGFIPELTEDALQAVAKLAQTNILQIRSLGGAMSNVESQATAFAHRDAELLIVCPFFLKPQATDHDKAKGTEPWKALTPFISGAYCNFFSEFTSEERSQAYPPETYRRLQSIKRQYDPDNVFHHNCNVIV